jgi:hydrogenase maturation protease
MTTARILVAGIGNVFMGDDGFGVAVAERLAKRALPAGVVVMDAGIRGIDLTYALMDGPDAAILVDLVRRGGPPGTLYVLDPTEDAGAPRAPEPTLVEAHAMDPMRVLAFVRASAAKLGELRVVGCEPASVPALEDDPVMGLTEPVEAAIPGAIELVLDLVSRFSRAENTVSTAGRNSEPRHA